jgi:hypothetical protein
MDDVEADVGGDAQAAPDRRVDVADRHAEVEDIAEAHRAGAHDPRLHDDRRQRAELSNPSGDLDPQN